MGRPGLALLAALVVALVVAPGAAAAPTQKKAIWGPPSIDGVSQFPTYRALGVGILEQSLRWDAVAPTQPAAPADPNDPAYHWPAGLDEAVTGARANGIRISLMVIGSPPWANGGKAWQWSPSPDDYTAFLQAVAARYPTIHLWMIWGEPTKAANYQPLTADRGKPLRGAAKRPAQTYATQLDRSYTTRTARSPANLAIGGNSYTIGTVAPLHWIAALRLPNGRPPRMDLYGHNPFSARKPDFSAPPLGDGLADFSDLPDLIKAVGHNLRRAGRTPRVFISEVSLPTDHPNFEFNFWVSDAVQASWLKTMLKLTRATRQLYTFGYLGLTDDAVRPDGMQVERGLVRRDGSHKPAFGVFSRG